VVAVALKKIPGITGCFKFPREGQGCDEGLSDFRLQP